MVAGAVKSAGSLVGTILDLVGHAGAKTGNGVDASWALHYKQTHPNASDDDVAQAYQQTWGAKVNQHVQNAADWLRSGSQPQGFWENVGAVGEQVLEYIGTDGLLRLAGAPAKVEEAWNAATRATEGLKNAQQIMQTLARNPKIAGLLAIGLKATGDAMTMAGQTYLHTEDPRQAVEAGGIGGLLHVGAEGVSAAGQWLREVAPRMLNIGGVDIPVLAPQLNEAGAPVEGGAPGAPKIAAAQQAQAPKVIENVAQKATATALDHVNQTRPVVNAIENPARMLPPSEGAQPFTFTLNGTPTAEEATGELLHPAQKGPKLIGPNQTYLGSSADQVAEGTAPRNQGTTGADITTEPERPNLGPPEARSENVTGGGVLQTTNPQTAESWLRQLEEVEQSGEFKQLSSAQQDAITTERERLADQLGMYHASPYAQRFAPADTENALNHVRTFGDAADQVQASVKPVYSKLDQVSGGQFTKFNNAAKQALKIMRSATSTDAYEAAEQRYHEATGAIDELLTRHAGDVGRQDYAAAKAAWRDSSRLNELHTVFERMMNGITIEESDQGLSRVMTGRTRQLEAYLSKGTNRQQIEALIGTDGVTNLKKITQLMSKANTNRATVGAARAVWNQIEQHATLGGAGGLMGGMIAHWIGAPFYEGVAAGYLTTQGVRAVIRSAMTNPRIGNMVDFAVQHGVAPEVYAPLIARIILEPMQQTEPEEEPTEDNGEPNP
jgi:hypothetical protein